MRRATADQAAPSAEPFEEDPEEVLAWRPTRKERFLFWLIPLIVDCMIRLLTLFGRTVEIGREHIESYRQNKRGFLYGIWHQAVLMVVHYHRGWGIYAMASASKDGEYIVRYMRRAGHYAIRGSSSRFGRRALKRLITLGRKGVPICIIPDGPRGPALELQGGIVTCAQITGLPIIPCHVEATREWVVEKAWDKHRIPKPFATLVVRWGPPIFLNREGGPETFEKNRLMVEAAMLDNLRQCQAEARRLAQRTSN
ncbi:MAG: lysophospholipid acyltransferase family protein [Leptospirales bacterium]|nr:lysophospholipid acyltransferase family protein [Leptospirales bacterium]